MKSLIGEHKFLRSFNKRALIPLVVLVIGVILITIQFVSNAGNYLRTLFVRVEAPLAYDFSIYNSLLKTYVKDDLVDYAALSRSPFLATAVKELESVSPARLADPRQQLAFWINTYNLLVLKNVCEHYPVKSIRQISEFLSLKKFVVGGVSYSANDIESTIIRPLLKQTAPKALFLLCGGARGYPPLLDHAISADRLDDDSNLALYKFVNNPNNVYFDPDTGTFYVSRLFLWNSDIILRASGSPFELANMYLAPDRKVAMAGKGLHTGYIASFDWWLNDTALGPPGKPGAGRDAVERLKIIPYSN